MPRALKWPPSTERRARVAELLSEGLDDAAIASRLGVGKGTVATYRRSLGVKLRPHGALPASVVSEIHRLYEVEEWPPGEISETLGLSPSTVNHHLGATETGKQWNAVSRWAAKHHRALWEELKR